jgi:hypothetical protein
MPPDNTHGVLVYGEIRYCTIFDEIYISQFLFGAGTLEAYEAEETVEREKVVQNGITFTRGTSFEKPQNLTRLPTSLELYKAEE